MAGTRSVYSPMQLNSLHRLSLNCITLSFPSFSLLNDSLTPSNCIHVTFPASAFSLLFSKWNGLPFVFLHFLFCSDAACVFFLFTHKSVCNSVANRRGIAWSLRPGIRRVSAIINYVNFIIIILTPTFIQRWTRRQIFPRPHDSKRIVDADVILNAIIWMDPSLSRSHSNRTLTDAPKQTRME